MELKLITVGVGNQGSTFQANSIRIQLQPILVKHANRDGNGVGLGRGSYPPPRYPCLIPHPCSASFSRELSSPCGYLPRPNMNFHFF